MTEHIKVFIGFYSGTVKACVLLGYGAVSFDKFPAWWCHLQGSNSSVGIQTLQKTPPLCLKTMGTSHTVTWHHIPQVKDLNRTNFQSTNQVDRNIPTGHL